MTPSAPTAAAPRAKVNRPVAANPTPAAPTTPGANPNALQNTTPATGAPTPTQTAPAASQSPLDQLVGNLVNSLPKLPDTLSGLLGQRSVKVPSQRSEKQLLDYLLAP